MESSPQNSSGMHWCRRVSFNEVPGKVPKVPEKVWEALVQSKIRFNRVPEKVPKKVLGSLGAKPSEVQQDSGEGSGKGSGDSQEGFGAEPGQVQQDFGESSEEGLGGFGAEPGQVQQGSGECSGENSGEGRGGRGGFGAVVQGRGVSSVWLPSTLQKKL